MERFNEEEWELNSDVTSSAYDSYCNEFENGRENIKKLCKKVAKYLKNLSELDKFNKENHHDVRKINYGLILDGIRKNDEIIQTKINQNCLKTEEQNNARKRHEFIGGLGTNYKLTSYKPCFYHIYCSFDECKEISDSYNYFKDYAIFKNKISSLSIEKEKKYYKYLAYVDDLYKSHRKKFCDDNFYWNDGDGYFKCEDKYIPDSIMPMLINSLQTLNITTRDEELSSIIEKYWGSENFSSVVTQLIVNFICTQKGDPFHRISYKLECKDTNSNENYTNKLGFNTKKSQRVSFDFSDLIHAVTLITTGILGMLVFSIILNKFTPFGRFVKRSVHREENIKDYNHDGYEEVLFGNNYNYANIKSQSRRVHLIYHPV
ncbi:PIR Superfamily Protein [Plasmodium ovale curtisi]|uniref:PIR Superfamily Protein n=1 Tax=Plasmodium ovale curtisi TaxID=864141 RepID=A0A1A8WE98_PLAOA|nr:PIR Superfamily Protein [Plasmodium ovale curtisi]